MTEVVSVASSIAIPDPRKETVPLGWWDSIVRPAIEGSNSFDELDEAEAKLRVFVSYIEAMGGDVVEFEKALRVVEKRRGELLPAREQGRRTDKEPLTRKLEVPAGTSGMTLSRWRAIAEHWDDLLYPYLQEASTAKAVTQTQLLRLVREHTPAKPDADVSDVEVDRVQLWHGDFRERLTALEPGSVDLIVTDPPYPKEDLPLYSDLAQVAAKLLGPRGVLFCWTGQIFLPEVLERLSEHLNYGWTFCLQLPGSGSRIMGRHIIQAWKPVVAFTPKTWPSGAWGDDLLTSPAREKAQYEWQQNAAPALRLIERYSPASGLIVDPFLGVGSFAVAAKAAGRRFIGVELDAGRFKKAQERVA